MTWARVSSIGIAVACALVIIANTPAVLTDTLSLAIAQIRVNAATNEKSNLVTYPETSGEVATSVKKSK